MVFGVLYDDGRGGLYFIFPVLSPYFAIVLGFEVVCNSVLIAWCFGGKTD